MDVSKEELLSAVVDDQGTDFESRRMLDEVGRDQQLRTRWERYFMIGEVLRGGSHAVVGHGIADRVMAELERLPETGKRAAEETMTRRTESYAKPLALVFSVAASIGLVAILVVNPFSGPKTSSPTQIATNNITSPQTPSPIDKDGTEHAAHSVTASPVNRPLINSYIVSHTHNAPRHGMMPLVRMVGYHTSGE